MKIDEINQNVEFEKKSTKLMEFEKIDKPYEFGEFNEIDGFNEIDENVENDQN